MKYLNETNQYFKALAESDACGNEYLQKFSKEDQYGILLTAKYALACHASKHGEDMSGACYNCKHRKDVPGDAHSSCTNRLAIAIGEPHGIRNGWFFHPLNFDPVWLRHCDGFEPAKPD